LRKKIIKVWRQQNRRRRRRKGKKITTDPARVQWTSVRRHPGILNRGKVDFPFPSVSSSSIRQAKKIYFRVSYVSKEGQISTACLVQIKLDNNHAMCTRGLPGEASISFAARTNKMYMSTPTSTTRVQLHSAPRLLVTRPHGLYVNLAVRRGYSSLRRSGSTSTTPYAATTSFSGRTTTSTTISTSKLVENGFRGINN
jgi:hypothetical protein